MTPVQQLRDDAGAAAVEFALISVVLVSLLFGIIQYGFFFFESQTAEHAVARAAQDVRVGGADNCTQWRAALASSTSGFGGDWDQVSWTPVSPTSGDPLQTDDLVEVTVPWTPTDVAGGLVPFPGGQRRATLVTTLQHLGVAVPYTSGVGCPAP